MRAIQAVARRVQPLRQFSTRVTVDEAELRKFASISAHWWNDVSGPFAPLHRMNAVRVPLIRKAISSIDSEICPPTASTGILTGVNVLDVGCGGGILSEALARLGATVVGIDAAQQNIAAATAHASKDAALSERLNYECTTAEALAADNKQFDCVVSSEVIEHVSDPNVFMEALSALVKYFIAFQVQPGGVVAITTINRTVQSFAAAVLGAEYILRLVEPGTHEWIKFVTPEELRSYGARYGLVAFHETGLFYNPLTLKWSYCADSSVNYGMLLKKPLL